jgi:hypothetical protein
MDTTEHNIKSLSLMLINAHKKTSKKAATQPKLRISLREINHLNNVTAL